MAAVRSTAVLSTEELHELLDERKSVSLATIGPDGRPHLTTVWALRDGDTVLAWTYAHSQKVRNLRRDPRATLMMEMGDSYLELRGATLDCDVELIDDLDRKLAIGARISAKFAGMAPGGDTVGADAAEIPEPVRKQAPKRIVLVCTPRRVRTWDHRKLTRAY